MIDISKISYPLLDRPEITTYLFYPRPDWDMGADGPVNTHMIPVADNVSIGARFHLVDTAAPNILFFHGNGEIVADYDDIAELYAGMGVNFLPVDYRGYGRSEGRPTVTSMMRDGHVILEYVTGWLRKHHYAGPLLVMGRSLGSASALDLAFHYPDRIDGLVIESGFAHATPLLQLLGIATDALGIREEEGFNNLDKIKRYAKPTLIIHAEFDHIIPFSDGEALFTASPAKVKRLLKIPRANHNDIFLLGMSDYMEAIHWLVTSLGEV